jgi:hypothetical protein
MTDLFPARTPHFNHVAMSLPSDMLTGTNKGDIVQFWSQIAGFEEIPQMTEDGKRLVLSAHAVEQFVFLIAGDNPMTCPRLDHYGISVGSLEDLQEAHARCVAYREFDPRVDLIDTTVDDYEVLKIHSFYVGYLLPMMLEIQYWEYAS